MKSAEFGIFPFHTTLPNAWEFFGDKKPVEKNKRFATLWETVFRIVCNQSVKFPFGTNKQKYHGFL